MALEELIELCDDFVDGWEDPYRDRVRVGEQFITFYKDLKEDKVEIDYEIYLDEEI